MPLKIAIIGARAMPARWGGFDTVVSHLAPRLVKRGYDVTVYCQPRYALPSRPASYGGVKLRYVPAARSKWLEAPTYEALCAVDAFRRDYDVIYVLGLRVSLVHLLHRVRGRPVIMNTDGFDWKRRKWGRVAQGYLRFSEAVGARFVATHLICDSRALQPYYASRYGRATTYISYGADTVPRLHGDVLSKYGLTPDGYYLVVARIEPENNIDVAIREHAAAGATRPLVIVGSANYHSQYHNSLREMASRKTIFLGGIYEPGHIDHIYANAYVYIHGHEVGGTNPSLLQAMGYGRATLAINVTYNREVLGDAGLYYEKDQDSLAGLIASIDSDDRAVRRLGRAAARRVRLYYNWDRVVEEYDVLITAIANGTLPRNEVLPNSAVRE